MLLPGLILCVVIINVLLLWCLCRSGGQARERGDKLAKERLKQSFPDAHVFGTGERGQRKGGAKHE